MNDPMLLRIPHPGAKSPTIVGMARNRRQRAVAGGAAADTGTLVHQAQAGDPDALSALIERCRRSIARGLAAAGYTNAFVDYEDAQQDALATIVERFPQSDDVASPCGWMHTVARNKAIARTRSKEVRRRGTERLIRQTTAADVTTADDYADDAVLPPDQLAALVLGGLRPEYRDVVVAYHLEEKSVAEIAAELHIAQDTVYTRLRRARKAMLAVLREHGHA